MTDTLWSDVSEFQTGVNNSYPYHVFCLRSHDGPHNDSQFMHNVTWANNAVASGKLAMYYVYYFYRPGFDGAASFKARIGPKPNPHMAAMIDMESAGGQVHGDQSPQANREFNELAAYLGDKRRVIGYGNTSDLNALWPHKPAGIRLVIAAYGSNPPYPGKFAHQFTDHANTPPFGPSDLNSADGMSVHDLQVMHGMVGAAPPPAPVRPKQMPGTKEGPRKVGSGFRWVADGSRSLVQVAAYRHASVLMLLQISAENLNPAHYAQMNKYVIAGVAHPMPEGLVFYTVHA